EASLDSLAETLVKAPKGAIAVWASSGMTSPDVQSPANQELYRSLFDKSNPSIMLGDAVVRAKSIAGNLDVRRTWILFGDPTMRVK
ncbi:MAG TPA: C25 family cysteine peptidase, partial [Blastocatellia bacterium]